MTKKKNLFTIVLVVLLIVVCTYLSVFYLFGRRRSDNIVIKPINNEENVVPTGDVDRDKKTLSEFNKAFIDSPLLAGAVGNVEKDSWWVKIDRGAWEKISKELGKELAIPDAIVNVFFYGFDNSLKESDELVISYEQHLATSAQNSNTTIFDPAIVNLKNQLPKLTTDNFFNVFSINCSNYENAFFETDSGNIVFISWEPCCLEPNGFDYKPNLYATMLITDKEYAQDSHRFGKNAVKIQTLLPAYSDTEMRSEGKITSTSNRQKYYQMTRDYVGSIIYLLNSFEFKQK